VRNAGAGGTANDRLDVTNVDLGTAASFGHNWVQTPTTVLGRNTTTGLSVAMGGNTVFGGPLKLAGNEMISGAIGTAGVQVDCSGAGGTVTKAANFGTNGNSCSGGAAIGKAANTVVTFTLTNCN
jgi:hypothetical protein